jgi:hypothetical protein
MSTLLLILQIFPALIKTIFAIEEALPQGGVGKEKLGMIRSVMETSYAGVSDIWPSVEKVIGVVVNTMNVIGAKK